MVALRIPLTTPENMAPRDTDQGICDCLVRRSELFIRGITRKYSPEMWAKARSEAVSRDVSPLRSEMRKRRLDVTEENIVYNVFGTYNEHKSSDNEGWSYNDISSSNQKRNRKGGMYSPKTFECGHSWMGRRKLFMEKGISIHGIILLIAWLILVSGVRAHEHRHDVMQQFGNLFEAIITFVGASIVVWSGSSFFLDLIADASLTMDKDSKAVGCILVALAMAGVIIGFIVLMVSVTGCGKNEMVCNIAMQISVGTLLTTGMIGLGASSILITDVLNNKTLSIRSVNVRNNIVVQLVVVVIVFASVLTLIATGVVVGLLIKLEHCDGGKLQYIGYAIAAISFLNLCIGGILGSGYDAVFGDLCTEILGYRMFCLFAQVLGCMVVSAAVCASVVHHINIGAESAVFFCTCMGIKVIVLDHVKPILVIKCAIVVIALSGLVIGGIPLGYKCMDPPPFLPGSHTGHHHDTHSHAHIHNHSHMGESSHGHEHGSGEPEQKKTLGNVLLRGSGSIMIAVGFSCWIVYTFFHENLMQVPGISITRIEH
ncbi:RND transporter MFP subunit, putative [Babesia ovis]|uniref:RND transporter MFP subunit, putative n=1 Tax=Babesia ovis TaxID=5869 RepID=A0A9W5TBM7_BABOV|nr:RND transporter MFP subunit, putative [Babesia ovis]